MEKKREKEIDFKLKPEDDASRLTEEPLPELIPSEAIAGAATVPESNDVETASQVVEESMQTSAKEQSSEHSQNDAGRNRPVFSRVAFRSMLIGLACLAIGAGLTQAWKWYSNAPRTAHPSVEFLTPTVLWGLVGDPDAAFAIQMVPALADEMRSSGPEMKAQIFVPEVQKQTSFDAVNRYLTQSTGDKSLSTLAMGTTLSASGRTVEAVQTVRPLINRTDNPIMKGYLALLLGLSGDLPGSLIEVNKGIEAGKTGKVWMYQSSLHTLYTMKANLLRSMGRPAEALAVLVSPECVECFKNNSWETDSLSLSKAAVYLQLGQPDKAIVLACQSKELNRMILSTAYLMKGDYSEALTHAQNSYLALSRIYSQQGRLDQALKNAEKADSAINSIITKEQRVYVLNQLKRYREALAISSDLTEFTKLNSANGSMDAMVQIHADRAVAFAHLGDAHNAILEANLALACNPNCRRALEAAKLASTILGDLAKVAEYQNRLNELGSRPDVRPVSFSSQNKP